VIDAFARIGDDRQALVHTLNLLWGRLDLGAYDEVEAPAREALEKAVALGMTFARHAAEYCLGRALHALGRPREAFDHLSAAASGFEEGGVPRLAGAAWIALSDLHLVELDVVAASRSVDRAVETLEDNAAYLALALATRARVRALQGRLPEALADAEEAIAPILLGGHAIEGAARLRLVHAEVLHAAGFTDRARVAITEARDAILAQADAIPDAGWRASFLEKVEDNARTLALAREWGAAARGEGV